MLETATEMKWNLAGIFFVNCGFFSLVLIVKKHIFSCQNYSIESKNLLNYLGNYQLIFDIHFVQCEFVQ